MSTECTEASTILPWVLQEEIPSFGQVKQVLDHYHPVELEEEVLINQIKMLIEFNNIFKSTEQKAYCIYPLFQLLEANLYFMKKHKKFRLKVQAKLEEFESTRKFSWFFFNQGCTKMLNYSQWSYNSIKICRSSEKAKKIDS